MSGADPEMESGPGLERVERPHGEPDCSEVVSRLYNFLDGDLTEERREKILRHLDECHPCLKAFGFEKELRQLIASRCKDHVPESLRQRIAASIEQERSLGAEHTQGASQEELD
ncbi:MAG: mycothiol system anti-sigma-R factor [Actinobacteria bacterium]|nr:mycothiol system anti-sigma-R factor [Actinomycetota bacterium]